MSVQALAAKVATAERRRSAGRRKVRSVVLYGEESADAIKREPSVDYVFYHVRRDGAEGRTTEGGLCGEC